MQQQKNANNFKQAFRRGKIAIKIDFPNLLEKELRGNIKIEQKLPKLIKKPSKPHKIHIKFINFPLKFQKFIKIPLKSEKFP